MNYLDPDEVAIRLSSDKRKVSGHWVRRELGAGRMRGSKVRGRWFVPEDAVGELMDRASNQPAPRKRRRRDIAP